MNRHRNAKLTVQECLRFDVGSLKPDLKHVDYEISVKGMSEWWDSDGRLAAILGYEVGRTKAEGLLVLVDPERTWPFSPPVRLMGEYIIPITTTRPRIGGVRYWFRCPVEHDRKPCGRRVKKLYLPPGEEIFGCRHCYDLTYRSCQKHDKRKYDLARDPVALDAALSSPDLRRAGLGIGALALRVREMQQRGWL